MNNARPPDSIKAMGAHFSWLRPTVDDAFPSKDSNMLWLTGKAHEQNIAWLDFFATDTDKARLIVQCFFKQSLMWRASVGWNIEMLNAQLRRNADDQTSAVKTNPRNAPLMHEGRIEHGQGGIDDVLCLHRDPICE